MLQTLLAGLVLLGVLVTIHEAGHFLVAKACGVRVLVFSLGFGPRLFGVRIGETDYRVSAVPLGGYVRMFGDDVTIDVPDDQKPYSFFHKPFLQKSAIAFAGPFANLLLPVVIFACLFVGSEKVPDAVVGTVLTGEPAERAGVAPGDRIVSVNGDAVATFDDVRAHIEKRANLATPLVLERDGKRIDVVVTPKDAIGGNVIFPEHVGRAGLMSVRQLPIVLVVAGSAAAQAGVQSGDRVQKVDDVVVDTQEALFAALDARDSKPVVLTLKRGDAAPQAVTITPPTDAALSLFTESDHVEVAGVTADELGRDDVKSRIALTRAGLTLANGLAHKRLGLVAVDGRVAHVEPGTPGEQLQLHENSDRVAAVDGLMLLYTHDLESALQSDPDAIHVVGVQTIDGAHPHTRLLAFRMAESPKRELAGIKMFGVGAATAVGDTVFLTRNVSVVEAVRRGVVETVGTAGLVLQTFGKLLSGHLAMRSLGGPISVFNMAGDAASQGIPTFVTFLAFFSVNLAVLNLMPVPVLDGGHIVMFTVELIRRRPITLEMRDRVMKVGLLLVGLLMVTAITNDIVGVVQSLFTKA